MHFHWCLHDDNSSLRLFKVAINGLVIIKWFLVSIYRMNSIYKLYQSYKNRSAKRTCGYLMFFIVDIRINRIPA